MKKFTILSFATVFAAAAFVGCNDSSYTPDVDTSSNVAIGSFSLCKDDSVLKGLDSVFFAIDLERARIFNADSMPYGTRTDKLVPSITTPNTVSQLLLTVKRADGTDTIHDYIANPNDTVDFSHGPAILTITSQNGLVKRDYTIDVNVHTVVSDTLAWSRAARTELPSMLAQPTAQHSSLDGTTLYSITYAGSRWAMAVQQVPDGQWSRYDIAAPAGADITTFTALDGKLYICASGKLYTSADGGRNWSATGRNWSYIYGVYADRLVGVAGTVTELFPGEASPAAIPEGMPVKECSQAVQFKFPMSDSAQLLFVGGVDASGNISPDTWAFDGSSWVKLSNGPLPTGLKGATFVPFYAFNVNSIFEATRYSILMVFGGNDGRSNNRSVYISDDYGLTWTLGQSLIQLPEYIPAMHSAQAYVFDITMTESRSAGIWEEFADKTLPRRASAEMPFSRATEPITSWECPYIYLYGGMSESGIYFKTIWRGTINRLKYKPIQ